MVSQNSAKNAYTHYAHTDGRTTDNENIMPHAKAVTRIYFRGVLGDDTA